ncbi:hypothetical protein EG329_012671 [Mollisiaceae sp. DMI_Dod_QoI]|nr:hypothetical protein EG329_012671 [Helotiales sp. DMI_Dod_QoI]
MSLVFIGLSGPSSCGKTTLAYLLKHIFPNTLFVLHADDFCKEFEDVPTVNGYLDCDGPDAIDYERMAQVLDHMKLHGGVPPLDFKSWQEEVFPGQEEKALSTVPSTLVAQLREHVQRSGVHDQATPLIIVDGFLLYQNPIIRARLRKEAFRQGYGIEAKSDEFWKTEDYFEKMVWRSYCEQHRFMVQDGNVEGDTNEEVCKEVGIFVKPGLDRPVDQCLTWTVEQIIQSLGN